MLPLQDHYIYLPAKTNPIGLGAVLTQTRVKERTVTPLYYASYPLIPTETWYLQIDCEALSIFWAIKKFHPYLYGKEFVVVTDHEPLVHLFNNPASKPSARIERWIMELQRYKFTVKYQAGSSNPADYASRHPVSSANQEDAETNVADNYIAYISENTIPKHAKAMTLKEVEITTSQDPVLQAVMTSFRSGKWHNPVPNASRSELSRKSRVI